MDISLSNIPAVICGMWVLRKCGISEYDWLGRKGKSSFLEWEVFHCHRRFSAFCQIFGLLLIHFLTGFFLINNFLIPPKHFFPIFRLLLWFGLGNIGFREGYEDIRTWNTYDRKFNEVKGRYRWLTVAILCTEAIVCYKYRGNTGNI